ncbi:hypothetical protein [Sorangium cellulosum]|uniref:Thiamine biosynthesis protein ThiF n=1 Tax=Sorangium cellulosum So0157-2 TaxID=1254432 RepID=S4Y4G8_SORCE|nr:hypothetical protein [Sorangium cellulosum]AGP39095.1 hypothetical protein SCE1572_34185 [Sorangium cellulosum So0157-2]
MDDPRYLRQVLLAEIGPEGQARLGAATACVLGGDGAPPLAREVAERYARGAGFGALAEGALDVDALAPADLVASPAARAVLAGARAALAEMRAALGRGAGAGQGGAAEGKPS